MNEGDHWKVSIINYLNKPILDGLILYLKKCALKLTEIVLSVKVLIMVGIVWISTYLLTHEYINGEQWVQTVVPLLSIVLGLREAYKLGRVFSGDSKEKILGAIKENLKS